MSIEITGQLKYRLQDHVCALLAVLAAGKPGISLQIEPQNGEDALLCLTESGNTRFIEIQIKGATTAITHDVLADWLAHFPERQASGSLLERLIANQERSVLFVASGRCNDAVTPHVVQLSVHTTQVQKGIVTTSTESGMRTGLMKYATASSSADKPLAQKRRANVEKQVNDTPKSDLKALLQRVLIAERLEEPEILRRIREELEFRHRVVPDRIQEVTRRITEIIVHQKRTGVDVMPEVVRVITSSVAVDPLVAASYVSRGEEADFLSRLSRDFALLLTGAPRVGKTFCARNLAASLQSQGYRVRICTDVSEAERYLTELVTENRAALVDDPLGGTHATDSASRELTQLGKLIPKLANSRRLIVSQAQDRLLQVSRCQSLDQIRTGNLVWVEMGIGAKSFLGNLWNSLRTDHAVPVALGDQIGGAIEAGQLDLEPGCLVYLAANHDRLDANASLADVIRYARLDSKSLGDALREEQLAPLMSALAIASTPVLGSAELELAFVLDDKRTDRPGKSDVKGLSTPPSSRISNVSPPNYIPLPALSDQHNNDLERLELRRMVSRASRRYTFSHPFYRASAESLVDAATARSTNSALSTLERALFTVAADTACAAASNLGWVYENLNSNEGRQRVVELAIQGLHSIFPAARDLCFGFLARRLASLPVERQSQISTWVHNVTMMKLSYVEWTEDGHPRIPAATLGSFLEVDVFPPSIDRAEVRDALARLDSRRPDPITARDAARVVMYLEKSPEELTAQIASRLLSIDISMIRAPIVQLWLSLPRDGDEHLLQRIFNEQHPAVTQAAYQGVLTAWPACSDERRTVLINGLQAMADSPISAAVLIDSLVVIARKEYGGAKTPWKLLEALMPSVLRQLPHGASFNDVRLYNVIETAIGNISPQSVLDIVDPWIDIVHQYAFSGIPSDYLLGVSNILISGIPSESWEREARVERLLAIPGTACRIRVVSDLVNVWEDLTVSERARLLHHLKTGITDAVWLQAAALTRHLVPAAIQAELLPEFVNLALPPEEVILKLPAVLLDACVHVFTGHHPIIYYLGVHGSRNTAWKSIIQRIARTPSHNMFDVAWERLLFMGETKELAEVARELGGEHAKRIAELLLERKQHTSGEFMLEVWDVLFELPVGPEVKSDWLSRMAALAPNALDSLEEHRSWIPEAYRTEFLSHFTEDQTLQKVALQFLFYSKEYKAEDAYIQALAPNVLYIIDALVESAPPKHWNTYDVILDLLTSIHSSDNALEKKIKGLRSLAIEQAYERREKRKQRPQNWDGPF